MARRDRCDEPGSWHHIHNRAISKRPVFLCRADYRFFLSCVARVVRLGFVEVHAFVLMRNHFHFLVRSPVGRLDEALKRVQNRYSRYLNRRLRRDGPLWRGRFQSIRVTSNSYHDHLVSYIDSNPVGPADVTRPHDFAWGSAACYARDRRPPWLASAWIEARVREVTGLTARDPDAYLACFPINRSPEFIELVERRLAGRNHRKDELDDLIDAEPAYVRDWLRRKAKLADGESDCAPVASAGAVLRVAGEIAARVGEWTSNRGRRVDAWAIVRAGLLRQACRLSFAEIARREGCARSTAHERVRAHRATLIADADYAERAAAILHQAQIVLPR